MKALPLALALIVLSGVPALAESAGTTVKPILRTSETASGNPIEVPAHPEVIVSTYEIAAHQRLPLHKHPFARYAYVLDGNLTVEVRDGGRTDYATGDFIVEVIGEWHTGVTGDSPVKLLVIDQVPTGETNTVLWEKKPAE
ncbi:cupin domain-containing protein [Amorphus coralli]|uniref:cupin domain-containing protein n=1 Tax=Amorphus coralli TaxID=340680 RepID=UPI0003815BF6|nr:cupin domain-containing protein [Amorphus coralli]